MRLFVLLLPIFLTACGLQRLQEERAILQKSELDLRACIAANMKHPNKCEAQKMIYELNRDKVQAHETDMQARIANMNAYNQMSQGSNNSNFQLMQIDQKLTRIQMCSDTPQLCR